MKSPIPGLSRGIQVLNLLSSPMTLDEVVRSTHIPKTTVLRILATLRREGVVAKNEASRTYLSTMELLPRESGGDEFERALEGSLARIARETGHTAEWYLPTPSGQVLARRHTPPNTEVHVRSWIGLVRFRAGLFDAVTRVGRATWLDMPRPGETFWAYGPSCRKIDLSVEEVELELRETGSRGYAADEHFSDMGVKRIACVVRKCGMPVGVLALAQCNVPGLAAQAERNMSILIREAAALSTEAEAKLDRTEPEPIAESL